MPDLIISIRNEQKLRTLMKTVNICHREHIGDLLLWHLCPFYSKPTFQCFFFLMNYQHFSCHKSQVSEKPAISFAKKRKTRHFFFPPKTAPLHVISPEMKPNFLRELPRLPKLVACSPSPRFRRRIDDLLASPNSGRRSSTQQLNPDCELPRNQVSKRSLFSLFENFSFQLSSFPGKLRFPSNFASMAILWVAYLFFIFIISLNLL